MNRENRGLSPVVVSATGGSRFSIERVFPPGKRWRYLLALIILVGTALWCFVLFSPDMGFVTNVPDPIRGARKMEAPTPKDIRILGLMLLSAWLIAAVYIGIAGLGVWMAKRLVRPEQPRVWVQWLVVAGFVLYVPWLFRTSFINPLPKDEEIIAYFHAHKTEIEAYVKYRRAGGVFDKAMEQRAGIHRVASDNIGGAWLPNPYSIETAKKVDDNFRRYLEGKAPPQEMPYLGISLQYAGLSVGLGGGLGAYAHPVRFGQIHKELWHVPVAPKVEGGYLLFPTEKVHRQLDGKVDLSPVQRVRRKDGSGDDVIPLKEEWMVWRKRRVFDSLNAYPPDYWLHGECVFRRIEPQWFIEMCRAS